MAADNIWEDVQFAEKLAEYVRKFPCLFNKSCKDYKDKFVVANAWEKVAQETGLEAGT